MGFPLNLEQITQILLNNFHPDTLFVGKEYYFYPELPSTNDWLAEQMKNRTFSEGTLIVVDEQTAGKGRLNRKWDSEKGRNLLLSLLLKPGKVSDDYLWQMTMAVSLAVRETIEHFVHRPVYVKWPNDLISENCKVSGILIENQLMGKVLQSSVIGIGLNINQENFSGAPNAASLLTLSGRYFVREEVLNLLCQKLEQFYLRSRNSGISFVDEYNRFLYGKSQEVMYVENGQTAKAVVLGVDSSGHLEVVTNEGLVRLHFNQVKVFYRGYSH